MRLKIVLLSLLGVALSGCTSIRTSHPERTATEQLLISTAADRAAERLASAIPAGDARVYIDARNFEGYDGKYAIGTIRDAFFRQGVRLTNDRKAADTIVEIRSGALSVDRESYLIGVPELEVPFPLAGTLAVPEIAFYSRKVQTGIAKFAATGYDAREGTLISSSGPQLDSSRKTRTTLLFFFSSTADDLDVPEQRADSAE